MKFIVSAHKSKCSNLFAIYHKRGRLWQRGYPIKKEKHTEIPAVTHVDGTGRLQTVEKGDRYYDLIEQFRQKTGTPILLNTSFNENEPIVNTPKEALACYLRTEMDMLVMENCVVQRK